LIQLVRRNVHGLIARIGLLGFRVNLKRGDVLLVGALFFIIVDVHQLRGLIEGVNSFYRINIGEGWLSIQGIRFLFCN
jgi:hypothetical protein